LNQKQEQVTALSSGRIDRPPYTPEDSAMIGDIRRALHPRRNGVIEMSLMGG
jgi:hypothetical protein